MNFDLDPKQEKRLAKWKESTDKRLADAGHDFNVGAAGGRYTYSFTPTNIGQVVKVYDSLGQCEIDLTDYDTW